MNKEYMKNLVMQYVNSTGTKNIDINSENFIQEFKSWLSLIIKLSDGYIELLKFLNVDYNSLTMAEVGKGKYDSIVLNNGSTIMITPYIKEKINNPLVSHQFVSLKGRPFIICKDKPKIIKIGNIMTQNPYSEASIHDFNLLHDMNECDITVGVYGENTDKDKEQKLKMLKNFSEKLVRESRMDGYEFNGNYFYAVTSSPKITGKVLKR